MSRRRWCSCSGGSFALSHGLIKRPGCALGAMATERNRTECLLSCYHYWLSLTATQRRHRFTVAENVVVLFVEFGQASDASVISDCI